MSDISWYTNTCNHIVFIALYQRSGKNTELINFQPGIIQKLAASVVRNKNYAGMNIMSPNLRPPYWLDCDKHYQFEICQLTSKEMIDQMSIKTNSFSGKEHAQITSAIAEQSEIQSLFHPLTDNSTKIKEHFRI